MSLTGSSVRNAAKRDGLVDFYPYYWQPVRAPSGNSHVVALVVAPGRGRNQMLEFYRKFPSAA